jgi:hypothetical protein
LNVMGGKTDGTSGVLSFDADNCYSQGTGGPVASLAPTSLNFGTIAVGSSSTPQTVTLSNTGTADLVVSGITLTGTNPGDFSQTSNCTTVAPNGSCTIQVTFTPTATGTRNATLTVADNATPSPQTASLTGVGGAPAVTFSPASVTFGNQPVGVASSPHAISLTNSGTAPLTITSITIAGMNPNDFSQTNNCPATLAAQASCTINAVFLPLKRGNRSDSVSVTDNASGSPQTVALSGKGT